MELYEFLAPVRASLFEPLRQMENGCLAHQIAIHSEMDGMPNLDQCQIALLGVLEDREAGLKGAAEAPDHIRTELYKLFPGSWSLNVCDLGNIYQGEKYSDTLIALQEVSAHLIKKGIVVLILGGSQDLSYANYRGYTHTEQTVNIAAIDARFDLGRQNETINNANFLSHIVLTQPYLLFNYSCLGYQSYAVSPEEIELMEKMFFDVVRLGQLRHQVHLSEPLLRDTDLVSFDFSAVRRCDAPGQHEASPNGLSGEEACALARYAGLSDKVSSLGLYNYIPYKDEDGVTARLAAQMMWYFLEGYALRKGDYPFADKASYDKFTVLIEEGSHELIFYKSPRSGRWWIEVPMDEKFEMNHLRHRLIPCSYDDYAEAMQNEIPERWWRAVQKSG